MLKMLAGSIVTFLLLAFIMSGSKSYSELGYSGYLQKLVVQNPQCEDESKYMAFYYNKDEDCETEGYLSKKCQDERNLYLSCMVLSRYLHYPEEYIANLALTRGPFIVFFVAFWLGYKYRKQPASTQKNPQIQNK